MCTNIKRCLEQCSINANGAKRFKNDPGFIDRTSEVYQGRFALKNSIYKLFINETDIEHLNKIICDGILAEQKVSK